MAMQARELTSPPHVLLHAGPADARVLDPALALVPGVRARAGGFACVGWHACSVAQLLPHAAHVCPMHAQHHAWTPPPHLPVPRKEAFFLADRSFW